MKKSRKLICQKDNVYLFPFLEDRLLEKGVVALKEKRFENARECFEQLNYLESSHPQAKYGLAICYVELGDYDRAEHLTERMLEEKEGHQPDVLRLYLTVLIQKRKYKKALEVMDQALNDGELPKDMQQTIDHLAAFCRLRLREKDSHLDDGPIQNLDMSKYLSELKEQPPEQQWVAIQDLQRDMVKEDLPDVEHYLLSKNGDPFIKSLLLNVMQEKQFNSLIKVYKFGQTCEVNLNSEELFYGAFAEDVKQCLIRILGSDNPTLCDLAEQVWGHFVIAAYPLPLKPEHVELWASACCFYAAEMSGLDKNITEISRLFQVSSPLMKEPSQFIRKIEEESSAKN
ncbi:tetratricopeptide repeat protein [Terrilactibacillus laevilacticus]|uniref:Tetratricopeptide repeat protein n=1 Tax=Terrilactibacillus laevilacticus TaxID=1380157 RepID=A0ABW5PT53_9BACI|nr:tetratricopeptide repeat protein [Terrilactibacillus laevilacticus]